jgi:hypothetical protein
MCELFSHLIINTIGWGEKKREERREERGERERGERGEREEREEREKRERRERREEREERREERDLWVECSRHRDWREQQPQHVQSHFVPLQSNKINQSFNKITQ